MGYVGAATATADRSDFTDSTERLDQGGGAEMCGRLAQPVEGAVTGDFGNHQQRLQPPAVGGVG